MTRRGKKTFKKSKLNANDPIHRKIVDIYQKTGGDTNNLPLIQKQNVENLK
ncbi:MAG: hypothetical protein K0B02_01870 [DPANN group archaeon]|nr:hypothetical protein [DPANN group archaeon]